MSRRRSYQDICRPRDGGFLARLRTVPLALLLLGFGCNPTVVRLPVPRLEGPDLPVDAEDGDSGQHQDDSEGVDPPRCTEDRSWVQVSAAGNNTCGVHGNGCVECWGSIKQVDDTPVGTFSFVAVKGDHACALTPDGRAQCWGNDEGGMSSPPDGTFTSLAVDVYTSCGLDAAGRIACWGAFDPSAIPADSGFQEIELDIYDMCAIDATGDVACFGTTYDLQRPSHTGDFGGLGLDDFRACAVPTSPGALECWLIDSGDAWEPDGLQTQDPFVDVCVGGYLNGCGLTEAGIARCWGYDSPFPPDLSFTQITCGYEHACGVTADGQAACWGLCRDGKCDVPI